MSLALRVTLVVAVLLSAAAVAAALLVYASVSHAGEQELQNRLRTRTEWLVQGIEYRRDELEFEPGREGLLSAEEWDVTLPSGQVLWASERQSAEHGLEAREARQLGLPAQLLGADVVLEAIADDERPRRPKSGKDDPHKIKKRWTKYRLPEGSGVSLLLRAKTSPQSLENEQARLFWTLLGVVPGGVLAVCLICGLLIRWQLLPLRRISSLAAKIGPQELALRIEAMGSAQECVQLRAALNGMLDRLAAGLERERAFAAMAAHELRTPLAQLRTHIEVALRSERTALEYKEALAETLCDVERLQSLVTALLLMTRIPAEAQAGTRLDLSEVVSQAAARFARVQFARPSQPVWVSGDGELLRVAISNVLENAQRYAPEGPLELSLTVNETCVELQVADHGPGVPETERERIFQPLTRLNAARTIGNSFEGFGLGLAIACQAVRACGGTMICSPRADGQSGAVFSFRFAVEPAGCLPTSWL